jgi:hypothetical protein
MHGRGKANKSSSFAVGVAVAVARSVDQRLFFLQCLLFFFFLLLYFFFFLDGLSSLTCAHSELPNSEV